MKVVQFKKTGNFTGNHDELTKALGGTVTYVGQHGKTETIKTYDRDNQTFPLQFNDWIVEIQGVIFVFNDLQYKTLLLELMNPPKENIGEEIRNAVKQVIKQQSRQSGLLAHTSNITTLNIQWSKL